MKNRKAVANRILVAVITAAISACILLPQTEYIKAQEAVSGNGITGKAVRAVKTVQLFSAESVDYCSVQIRFLLLDGADGYEIYRGTEKKEEDMKLIREMTESADGIYTDSESLQTGTKYYYKVRAYEFDQNGQKVYGDCSNILAVRPKPTKAAIEKVEAVNYNTLAVSYKEVAGASGYSVYRSSKKDGTYKKVGTLKDGKALVYEDEKCEFATSYYYKVRAYTTVNGKKKYGAYSDVVKGKTSLTKPTLRKPVPISADTVLLKWKKVAGAEGYMVYRSEEKKGTYKRVRSVKGEKTTTCQLSGQENGKTYYYKIRAYRKRNGKKKYSPYSNLKKAAFNILATGDETYQQKAQRIFGLDYYIKYASREEADKHMKTFGVYVWDYSLDGEKITKYRMITVHENIADTVKQIFKEIYEGEERFPIKNLGGYSWRGDSSNSEHCMGLAIDINWEENYMIDGDVILSGKYWKPGEDPYSIPADGDVVRIMRKYGFSWGIWGQRRDYMHFSYFGT